MGMDAAEIRPQDELTIRPGSDGSFRWHRCLRCDSWVPLPIPSHPDVAHPPERGQIELPLRGKALRDRFILRLIAVERAIHFLVLAALGIAVLAFAGHETSLRSSYYTVLTDLQNGVSGSPVQVSGHVGLFHELDKLFSVRSGRLEEVGLALLAYAVLEGVEAVGLWMTKRWAEYLTFLATAIPLPLEIYEIVNRRSGLKIFGFLLNLAVVAYLLFAKRLFGLRGGARADEQRRAQDNSWEALERSTPSTAETAPTP